MKGRVRIGLSGWRYPEFRGAFYPKGLRQAEELAFAAARFESLELNGSFYSLQTPKSYARWAAETPDDFVFAVKGSRFITHMKKLRDVETPLANFFASGPLVLGNKLGPFLWQLPANLAFDRQRTERFFALLPRTTREAAALARRHDERVEHAALGPRVQVPLRHAVEVRHESFLEPSFADLCRANEIAVVVADTAGTFPVIDERTADFTYVRLHGDTMLYVSGYSDAALSRWAERVRTWNARGDVYVYFDNTAEVRAPFDAAALRAAMSERAALSVVADISVQGSS